MADIGSLSYRPQPVDMQALLQDTCARFDAAATAAGLQLSCDAGKLMVLGDPDRLRQLIDNLISNSLNYSARGGRIDMILAEDAGRARVRVDDTPPGVDSSELGRLFDPLYRGEASRNRQHGGSGLGLAIAQRIAVAHGGELGAMPSPLGGLRIELWLPLEHP
jgi:two-component system sensor histidine kinase BaeS